MWKFPQRQGPASPNISHTKVARGIIIALSKLHASFQAIFAHTVPSIFRILPFFPTYKSYWHSSFKALLKCHHCPEFPLKAPFWILFSSSCVSIALCCFLFSAPVSLSLGVILASCIHGCLSNKTVSSANERDLNSLLFIYPLSLHQANVLLYQGRKRKKREKAPRCPQKWQEPQLYSSEGLSWVVLPSRCFYSTGYDHRVLDK